MAENQEDLKMVCDILLLSLIVTGCSERSWTVVNRADRRLPPPPFHDLYSFSEAENRRISYSNAQPCLCGVPQHRLITTPSIPNNKDRSAKDGASENIAPVKTNRCWECGSGSGSVYMRQEPDFLAAIVYAVPTCLSPSDVAFTTASAAPLLR